jgi:hypothetical protein
MLTNWKTILKSISQIRPILKQKQKILQKILEKRQKIQRRLFNKVYLLRKKSRKFMNKGKYLIRQILLSKNFFIEKNQKFMQTKNAILSSNMALLTASKNLKQKKNRILKQIQQLELAATEILKQKQQLKSLIHENITKFHEFEQFFAIGQELLKTKNSFEKQSDKKFVALSYEKLLTINNSASGEQNTMQLFSSIPNPSPEMFKKMIAVVSNLRKEDTGFFLPKSETQINNLSNRSKSTEKTADADFDSSSRKTQNTTIVFSKFLNKFILFLPF